MEENERSVSGMELEEVGRLYPRDWFQTRLTYRKPYRKFARAIERFFNPSTVIDMGCGSGAIIEYLRERGKEVAGVEGSEGALHLLPPGLKEKVKKHNLCEPFHSERRFDLAICIEVAEHLPGEYAETLVGSLTRASDRVLFTAAPPGQGGVHHVNERPRRYWKRLFRRAGFRYRPTRTAWLRSRMKRATERCRWVPKNLMIFTRRRRRLRSALLLAALLPLLFAGCRREEKKASARCLLFPRSVIGVEGVGEDIFKAERIEEIYPSLSGRGGEVGLRELKDRYPLLLAEEPEWGSVFGKGRSRLSELNALNLNVKNLLIFYMQIGNPDFLRLAARQTLHYIENRLLPSAPFSHDRKRAYRDFIWYDRGVAVRTLNMVNLLLLCDERDDVLSLEERRLLVSAIERQCQWLMEERNYRPRHNHGISQDIALIYAGHNLKGSYPEAASCLRKGLDRLRIQYREGVSGEGIHLEHSPHYHLFVLEHLSLLLRYASGVSLPLPRELEEREAQMVAALVWLLLPGNTVPLIGDGFPKETPWLSGAAGRLGSAETLYMLTEGASGERPSGRLKSFSETGYVIFRDRWPGRGEEDDSDVLIFTSQFHSHLHKHGDDGSFVWYRGKRPLLIDAGPFAYEYDRPERKYCVSTRAHNTLEVDGESRPIKKREYRGSGVGRSYEDAEVLAVELEQRGIPGVRHRRVAVWKPPSTLLVVDALESARSHDYRQYFHLAPEFRSERDGKSVTARGEDGLLIRVQPLTPLASPPRIANGEKDPLLGWHSWKRMQFEPNDTVVVESEGEKAVMATLVEVGRGRDFAEGSRFCEGERGWIWGLEAPRGEKLEYLINPETAAPLLERLEK